MPKVITVTNQKGGTGKTTLTALLAYSLASRGYNVLLLDLDPQAHLSSFFIPTKDLQNVSDGIIEMAQWQERGKFKIRSIKLRTKGEISIIPSGLDYIIRMYRGLMPTFDPLSVQRRIETEPQINKKYDFILCDTAPELFPPTLWGLYASNYILIPTNNEELSFSGVRLFIKDVLPDVVYYKSRKNSDDIEPKVLGIVLVNVVKRITQNTINRLNESFKRYINQLPNTVSELFYERPLLNTVIYRYQELRDLTYTPRKRMIPLDRIISKSKEIQESLNMLSNEILERMRYLSKTDIVEVVRGSNK